MKYTRLFGITCSSLFAVSLFAQVTVTNWGASGAGAGSPGTPTYTVQRWTDTLAAGSSSKTLIITGNLPANRTIYGWSAESPLEPKYGQLRAKLIAGTTNDTLRIYSAISSGSAARPFTAWVWCDSAFTVVHGEESIPSAQYTTKFYIGDTVNSWLRFDLAAASATNWAHLLTSYDDADTGRAVSYATFGATVTANWYSAKYDSSVVLRAVKQPTSLASWSEAIGGTNAFVVGSARINATGRQGRLGVKAVITDSVRYYRGEASAVSTIEFGTHTIRFTDGTTVYQVALSFASGDTIATGSIGSAVDTSIAIPIGGLPWGFQGEGAYTVGDDWRLSSARYYFTNTTTLAAKRKTSGTATTHNVFVIIPGSVE